MKKETTIEELCKWVKEEKGITEIDLMDLVEMLPEYEEWKANQEIKD